MERQTVQILSTLGKAVNIAAGHVGEMTGSAIQAASQAVGCPVGATVGRGIRAAGQAWSKTAVQVANRDAGRLTRGDR